MQEEGGGRGDYQQQQAITDLQERWEQRAGRMEAIEGRMAGLAGRIETLEARMNALDAAERGRVDMLMPLSRQLRTLTALIGVFATLALGVLSISIATLVLILNHIGGVH